MFLKVGGQKNLLENYCNFNISCKETFSADRTVDGAAEEEEGAWKGKSKAPDKSGQQPKVIFLSYI